jgi:aspartate racemase
MIGATIGVIGGMGPLATADFFTKVVNAATAMGAVQDEDHVPLLLVSDPRIPGRPAAILHGAQSPLPAMLALRDNLIASGAVAIAMPCNTAHYWIDDLSKNCPVPFLSIIDAACDALPKRVPQGAKVGLIATGATLQTKLFETPLRQRGYEPLLPTDQDMQDLIIPAIALVKAGQAALGGHSIETAVQRLLDRGAAIVVLACTETPLAIEAIASPLLTHCIDTNSALAQACVRWWANYAVK